MASLHKQNAIIYKLCETIPNESYVRGGMLVMRLLGTPSQCGRAGSLAADAAIQDDSVHLLHVAL